MSPILTEVTRSELHESAQTLTVRGIRDCDRGRHVAAVKSLERAASLMGQLRALSPRGLAAYGLSLASTEPLRRSEAIGYCKLAIRRSPADPVLYRLLAKTYLLQGSRGYAVHTLDAGLKVNPEHPGLRQSRSEVGLRAAPLIPSLGRSHLVNRIYGRLRYRFRRLVRL
jgi:hypothetical protein